MLILHANHCVVAFVSYSTRLLPQICICVHFYYRLAIILCACGFDSTNCIYISINIRILKILNLVGHFSVSTGKYRHFEDCIIFTRVSRTT